MPQNDYLISRFAPVYVGTGDNAPLRFKANVGIPGSLVSASPISFFGYNIYNPNSEDCFLKMYDNEGPTVGVTSVTLMIHVPGLSSVVLIGTDVIYRFESALVIAATTAYNDGSNVAPAIDLYTFIFYR
jgi:hypothetical protein